MSGTLEADAPATRRRHVIGWTIIGVVVLVVGIVGAILSSIIGSWEQRVSLDPESAGPPGGRALARILEDHGVEVTVARDLDSALAALSSGDATLALVDSPYLSDDGLQEVTDAAAEVVLIDPRARSLHQLLPGSEPRGFAADAPVEPECGNATADRAGTIRPGALFAPGDGVTGCYPVNDAFGLLVGERVAAVDGTALFTNEHLAHDGNAALGIGLLGQHETLVWYMPTAGDLDSSQYPPTLGELTPKWVSPVILLLLCAGIAAALWRGRRFGPLVAERLPVTVRASETMEGRARLYARSRDAGHAIAQLRFGALERIARMLALGPAASADTIADAAADRIGADRGAVRGILITEHPTSDAHLVALSDRLRELETAVRAAVHTVRNRP